MPKYKRVAAVLGCAALALAFVIANARALPLVDAAKRLDGTAAAAIAHPATNM
jgi:predicted outer membrane lipoprotein